MPKILREKENTKLGVKGMRYRQGQTWYYVEDNWYRGLDAGGEIKSFFLHSQKTHLPPEGERIEKMPVDHFRGIAAEFKFHATKNRAIRELNSRR